MKKKYIQLLAEKQTAKGAAAIARITKQIDEILAKATAAELEELEALENADSNSDDDVIVLDERMFDAIQENQFQGQAPVYDAIEPLGTIPSGKYIIKSEVMPDWERTGTWTKYTAHFKGVKKLGDKPTDMSVRYKNKEVPDTDADIRISIYKANRNWPTDENRKVKDGQIEQFCVNA